MRPLEAIGRSAQRLAQGDFQQRVPEAGDREFLAVARQINRMADQLSELYDDLEQQVRHKSRQLVRSERLAGLGRLAAGVAHEINNPLAIMSGHAELGLRRLQRRADRGEPPESDEAMLESLAIVRDETRRCKQITERLLSLSRAGGPRRPCDLGELLESALALASALPTAKGRRIQRDGPCRPESLWVSVNEGEVKQVLLNLLTNALEATAAPDGATAPRSAARGVWVRLDRRGPEALVEVRDDGCGMNPEQLERVFEPFYTDKRGQAHPGTGLGLSIAHGLAREHGGRIEAASPGPGCGSRFTLYLPLLGQRVGKGVPA
jgi:signal transduction histidine kinase